MRMGSKRKQSAALPEQEERGNIKAYALCSFFLLHQNEMTT
jgi:hypothetical protein